MDSYTETFGPWHGTALASFAGVGSLAPAAAASYDATVVPAGAGWSNARVAVLGQSTPITTADTHKSMTRPGSPPRGRLR